MKSCFVNLRFFFSKVSYSQSGATAVFVDDRRRRPPTDRTDDEPSARVRHWQLRSARSARMASITRRTAHRDRPSSRRSSSHRESVCGRRCRKQQNGQRPNFPGFQLDEQCCGGGSRWDNESPAAQNADQTPLRETNDCSSNGTKIIHDFM